MLTKLAAGLLMLSVLVIIHEAGHMVIARLFKVGVPVFSVGMGPRIAGFRFRGTDYRFSAVPVGGYVQMAGADPFGEEDPDAWVDPAQDFMKKPVWQRLLILLAGPAANLILPLVVLSAVFLGGEERPDAVVGMVLPDSPAAVAGLVEGDEIISVNGEPVDIWVDLARGVQGSTEGAALAIGVRRGDREFTASLPPSAVELTEDGFADLRVTGLSWMRVSSQIGVDDPTSPAARAGLRTGDGVTKVDGKAVETWSELIAATTGPEHAVEYRRPLDEEARAATGERYEVRTTTLRADPTWVARDGDPHANPWGLVPVMLFVGAYAEDSAAADAGVKLDDRIYAVDGQVVRDWYDLLRLVKATAPPPEAITPSGGCLGARPEPPAPRSVSLTVVRDGALTDLAFEPRMTRELVRATVQYRPLLGIVQYPDAFVDGAMTFKRYAITQAVPEAARETWSTLGATFGVLGQFFAQERKLGETIGGPIAIFDMAGKSAESGLASFARMLAAISIGLGIVNLLPVPALDGGQILFYAIEGVRGRPLSMAIRERVQMVGVLFLVALILVVSVNDISRVFRGG